MNSEEPQNSSTPPMNTDETIALYERHIYDLQQMLEISKSFCTTLELPALIESIVYIAMAQMRVTGAGIFIFESIDSTMYKLSNNYSGLEIDPTVEYTIPVNCALIEKLGSGTKVFSIESLLEDLPDDGPLHILSSLKPSLVVPLILKNRVNGILVLGERIVFDNDSGKFTDYEKNEISTIASLASVAVNNASLIEQSSTDMMTKLKLKYYFFNVLTDKLDKAFSEDIPLSVVMFDIDFFKKFNDTYGHACGDYVLMTVAKIIKSSIRGEDMASRYGGEEFTVMLYNANRSEAIAVAERIRKNIEKNDFYYQGQHMQVTISGGISIFSAETNPVTSAKVLVDQADRALYLSKRNGRNRVTCAAPETDSESEEAK